jgi:hypothetical protein|tara:strand:- start:261 stop:464 length:204 start_codon:yes stop_codon:yes gene_type:complete
MDTDQYFKELATLDSNNLHPEGHTFITVWVKSNMPEMFNELVSKYKTVEGDIYARNACDAHNSEVPF